MDRWQVYEEQMGGWVVGVYMDGQVVSARQMKTGWLVDWMHEDQMGE